jgi:type VI secretion system FHA domain protein
MPLHLKIVSEHRDLIGDSAEYEFGESGGTVGRSLDNDWVLTDPKRYLSARHATIDYKAGMYYLLDTSSNGVYFNDEVEPIGKGNTRRIFSGDSIRMGDFQFAISIDSGESIAVPLDSEVSEAPDNSMQRVDEASHYTDLNLVDEEEITGDDEFRKTLFGTSKESASAQPSKHAANDEQSLPDRPTTATPPQAGNISGDELFDAFMEGLGISPQRIHPSLDRVEVMSTAGSTLREMVEGLISLLASRASLKNAFKLDQTALLPRYNNPLKFSEKPDDLLMQLLLGSEGDYLGASDAVREVCRDLLNHQNAFLDAMNTAFIEFADRFAPDELQEGFDRVMTGLKQLAPLRKAKYWDLYTEIYPMMTEKGGGRFPQMFGEEFIGAYERQIAEYRRHDRGPEPKAANPPPAIDPGLAETRQLDQSELGQAAATPPPDSAGDDDEVDNEVTVEIRPPGRKLSV